MTLTVEQIESLRRGEPVRMDAPELGEGVVVIRESVFRELREASDDEKEKAAWAELARKARDSWAADNAY